MWTLKKYLEIELTYGWLNTLYNPLMGSTLIPFASNSLLDFDFLKLKHIKSFYKIRRNSISGQLHTKVFLYNNLIDRGFRSVIGWSF